MLSAVVAAATAVLSLLAGLALGAGLGRALATGFYLAGVFFVIVGVAAGIRGPFRAKGGDDAGRPTALFGIGLGARGVRTASGDERQEAVSTSALFLVLGFVLIILGIAADSTTELA